MKNPKQFFEEAVRDSLRLKEQFFEKNADQILALYQSLQQIRQERKKAFIFGNGGSAADAQHFAAELMHRVDDKPIGIAAIALHTDSSLVTAISNDEGFARIFSIQIRNLAQPGDVAIAISTSGRSINIVEGLRAAREMNCKTIGLLGRDGGEARKFCDQALIVPHQSTPRIQEVHGMVIHLVCQLLEMSI